MTTDQKLWTLDFQLWTPPDIDIRAKSSNNSIFQMETFINKSNLWRISTLKRVQNFNNSFSGLWTLYSGLALKGLANER
jgi:hypothetical protein